MYFSSKKDVLFSIIIWAVVLLMVLTSFYSSDTIGLQLIAYDSVLGHLIRFLIVALLFWLWFGTGYQIKEGMLTIRFGPFRKRVNIKDIKSLRKTKSILAAPALSIDRLEVLYGSYHVTMISPKHKDQLIDLLLKENPHIKLDEALSIHLKDQK